MTRDRLRALVATSRRAQGLSEHVTDARFLDELAAEVIDREADTVEFPALRLVGGEADGAA